MNEKFGTPENQPLSEEYKRGWYAALKVARECIERQKQAYGLSWKKKDDADTSQMGVLSGVDTAIQQKYPR